MPSKANYDKTQAELAKRELSRRHYSDYLAYVGGKTWVRTRFSEFLAEKVQEFIETDTGHAYDILILETPPQHGKSMTVTEALPSWYLGKYPDRRVIEVSYNDDTGERFLRKNKDKVKKVGKTLFGITIGKIDRADHFELSQGGSMLSRGIMSGITGNPADLMIIDDPIKSRQEADSETTRNRLWGEWLNSMKSRLSAGAKVILIMTPWHEDDMAARMLRTEACADLIRLPVEAQDDDPLGRSPGEPLCPEIGKGAEWLEQFKGSYLADAQGGPRAWSSLYMCNPVIEGGNMVKREWWQYYDPKEITTFGTECISVDAAFKDGKDNDYVSIQVWGKLKDSYYLRYCCNEHLDFAGTVRKIRTVRGYYPKAGRLYIEDKANGSAIIQTLQREMPGVMAVNPMGGKVARVNAVSPAIETGHVFLPKGAPWLEDYLKQWSEFPAGKHDDMVDASTQALSKMQYAWGEAAVTEETEEEEINDYETALFLSGDMFDPYGIGPQGDGYW
jgi:predicted phage terminase large subunit-like protein